MRHAVTMETEVHGRNSSFMIAPSSTVITNLSRKAMIAITGLMLFTIKRANAIQTLLDMTAASASLATMAKTGHRKKPWLAKISSSCQPRRRINTYTLTCPVTASAIMWWLWPHIYEEINKTVMANRDPTALFHNISNYDLVVWNCSRQHFPT